ncbi:MAG: RsmD family RNA methyltransferase [Bacteroides sp.]|nr:RsmD family RNA methyltransferase [Bacteroides sp.]MCM1095145.1 RsmD family RNA methyltransferase [Terasakiella sp.]
MRIIRGKYGRRRFDVPGNITARPTTDFARENIFNVIENIVDLDGATALDLFAGTGAISLEFLSRECASVTCVEKAATQYNFIRRVVQQLNAANINVLRGDALRYLETCRSAYDIVFADPPYDMPGFAEVPGRILSSGAVRPGTLVIVEHSKAHDFSSLPGFFDHRQYGSVNFSLFRVASPDDSSSQPSESNQQ